jgi:3-oxoadipate enol-lactonase
MAFTRLGDIVVHHEEAGIVGSPAIVFANSLGTDLRIWDVVLSRLPGRFRAVRYDMRGHGLTDETPGPYTVAELADDLARLLDRLGIKGALLCGLSIGGMIAQQLAVARPDLVRALVLMDTAHKIGTAETWQQRIDAVTRGGIGSIADEILARWFAASFHAQHADELAGYRNMLARTPAGGYVACCAAIRDADLSVQASLIRQPCLCVAGEVDGATPPDLVRKLARLIPGARFELIAQAGHLPCVEQPDATARALHAFIKENALVG